MPFRPINAKNAVLEGVAVLRLDRPLTSVEVDAIKAAHPRLRLDLPRLEEAQGVSLFVGSVPPPGPPHPYPFSMSSYQRDGSLEARLTVNSQLLVANFLVYSHWNEHWEKALLWFQAVRDAIVSVQPSGGGASQPRVAVLGHQMVDVFPWNGSATEVSASSLLLNGTGRLPEMGLHSVGQAWSGAHAYTLRSPTEQTGMPAFERLDVLTCDLGEELPLGWRLRLDHFQETRLHEAQSLEHMLTAPGMFAGQVMYDMHKRNRELVLELLSEHMLTTIGLRKT